MQKFLVNMANKLKVYSCCSVTYVRILLNTLKKFTESVTLRLVDRTCRTVNMLNIYLPAQFSGFSGVTEQHAEQTVQWLLL